MTQNLYNDYLQHHGVKGMKWGVRRAAKRATRMERYRDKLAKRADRRSKTSDAEARFHKREIDDLKDRGRDSTAFRRAVNNKSSELQFKAQLEGRPSSAFANAVISEFSTTPAAVLTDLKSAHSAAVKDAKTWASRKSDVMNMDVSQVSRRDIRRAYRGKS